MDIKLRWFKAGEDEDGVNALWTRIFGEPVGGQSPAWLFRKTPAGEAPRVVAEVDGSIVAHAGGIPIRFKLDDDTVRGVYSVGTMTAPEMRGRRLYFKLATFFYEKLEESGYAFVAGFSNRNSYRLFTGPLQRTPIRPFPWCVKPIRPVALLRSLVGGRTRAFARPYEPATAQSNVRVVSGKIGDPGLDDLWAKAGGTVRMGAVRDGGFNAWRFQDRTGIEYFPFFAIKDDALAGFCILRMLTVRNLPSLFIVDFLFDPDSPEAGRLLLKECTRFGRSQGAVLVSALFPGGGLARKMLRRAGFYRVPEALHPQLINFSVKGLGTYADNETLADARAWFLSWADTDVV